MLVLTTNNKSVDWICKLMKVLPPSPLFMYVQEEMRGKDTHESNPAWTTKPKAMKDANNDCIYASYVL